MGQSATSGPCWSCDGAGVDGFDGCPCSICHGKGTVPADVAQGRSIIENDAIQAERTSRGQSDCSE